MDFVQSIQLQLSDLERSAEIGYVDSLSNLFIQGLNEMEVTDRPIHCTDAKRDVLYVKDNDAWEKEGSNHDKMSRAVNRLNFSNTKLIGKWVEENPDCKQMDTPQHQTYMNMLSTMTPDDEEKKRKRVIKNIAKTVFLGRDELKENKVKLIGDTYTIGAEGLKVIFIHPSSTGGVLVELAEVND